MYEYDHAYKKKEELPEIQLTQKEKAIEFVLVSMTAAALVFFFLKVMFF